MEYGLKKTRKSLPISGTFMPYQHLEILNLNRTTKKVKERKPTLSPTRINTYLTCRVKYRHVYIDKIGRFYLKSRPYFSFGTTLHSVLQTFHTEGGVAAPESMVAKLDEAWVSAGYESAEQEKEHREAGEKIVQAYAVAHQARLEEAVETIALEKTINFDMGRFKLSGRVDRIDRYPDGRLEIIDYKSGKNEITPEAVASDLAMNVYQLILKRNYPDTPVFSTIQSLRTGSKASAELGETELTAFEAEITQLGNEILDCDYTAISPQKIDACECCDFLPRCARFWDNQELAELLDAPFDDSD